MQKEKLLFCIKKKLPHETLFAKLNSESEHNTQYNSTLTFLCFHQYFDKKKVGTSCPELSTKQLGQLGWHCSRVSTFYLAGDSTVYVSATI